MKLKSNLFCLLLIVIVATGCGARTIALREIAASSDDPAQPFILSIIEEVNDGERLHVSALVKVKDTWDISNVLLHLKAMKNGDTVGEAFYPLIQSLTQKDQATSYVLKSGDSRSVRISVDAHDLTDYQLDLVWGQEAEQFLNALPKTATVEIRDVSLVYNKDSKRPLIAGKIANKGRLPLTEVSIGINFIWVAKGENLDLSQGFPENETIVPVTGISIQPGASQPFAIEVEKDMPKSAAGNWEPTVRVVENNGSSADTQHTDSGDESSPRTDPPAHEGE